MKRLNLAAAAVAMAAMVFAGCTTGLDSQNDTHSLTECEVTLSATSAKVGTADLPTVSVTYDGTALTENTDYTVSGLSDIKLNTIGTYPVTVTGTGSTYTDSVTRYFEVEALSGLKATLECGSVTGNSIEVLQDTKNTISVIVKDDSDNTLGDTNYTVSGLNGTSTLGTYTVTVTGKDNYAGKTATATYTVKEHAFNVTGLEASYTYTGSIIEPTVAVTYDDVTLTEDTDYTVTYTGDTTNIGTVNVTVTLSADYNSRTTTRSYEIIPVTGTITLVGLESEYAYTGSAFTPVTSVTCGSMTLKEKTDYTITYANNTNLGKDTASVTVTLSANYGGSTVTKNFSIYKLGYTQEYIEQVWADNGISFIPWDDTDGYSNTAKRRYFYIKDIDYSKGTYRTFISSNTGVTVEYILNEIHYAGTVVSTSTTNWDFYTYDMSLIGDFNTNKACYPVITKDMVENHWKYSESQYAYEYTGEKAELVYFDPTKLYE